MLSAENEIILLEWDAAIYTLEEIKKGQIAMSWPRIGSKAEDEVVAEANSLILDTLANADSVNFIERSTGRDLRSQLTIQEAIEMNREIELRKFNRRN